MLEGCRRKSKGNTNIVHGSAVKAHDTRAQKFFVPCWCIITGLLMKAIAEMYVTAIEVPKSNFND